MRSSGWNNNKNISQNFFYNISKVFFLRHLYRLYYIFTFVITFSITYQKKFWATAAAVSDTTAMGKSIRHNFLYDIIKSLLFWAAAALSDVGWHYGQRF